MGTLEMELCGHTGKQFSREFKEVERVDVHFWIKVFKLKTYRQRYLLLTKLVSTLLTIVSGPLIESTFNIMDEIVEIDRTKLTIENYEAVAIVKSTWKKENVKTAEMKVTSNMKKVAILLMPVTKKNHLKLKRKLRKKRQEQLNISFQQLQIERAKRVAKLHQVEKKKGGETKWRVPEKKEMCRRGEEVEENKNVINRTYTVHVVSSNFLH